MQSYSKNLDLKKIRTINGYQWAILAVNQEIVGSKLGITKNIVKHVPMFLEMLDFQRKHKKWDYVYRKMGEKYHLSPSSVKRVRFSMLREVFV